jgi:hypothetical protein
VPTPELPPLSELCVLVAGAADLCRRPLRHAVLPQPGAVAADACEDCCLSLQARAASGERLPAEDLELELYRSGSQLHLTLAWAADPQRPLLWQGGHPVWMEAESGQRCERPDDGLALESLARRLRSLLG